MHMSHVVRGGFVSSVSKTSHLLNGSITMTPVLTS